MIELLIKYNENEFGVISQNEISEGDEFEADYNKETKRTLQKIISEIKEQRKEKGSYKDESKRKFWARVITKH